MFSVLFEVFPRDDQWDNYLANAKMLRPELEKISGFVDNIRYKSLTREGWILSLSNWRDEKAVVRWRTLMRHHAVQEKGRSEILRDYHLRVGQITEDTRLPRNRHRRSEGDLRCEPHRQPPSSTRSATHDRRGPCARGCSPPQGR